MYLDAINYLPYPDRDASKSSERSTISMRDLMPDKTSLSTLSAAEVITAYVHY